DQRVRRKSVRSGWAIQPSPVWPPLYPGHTTTIRRTDRTNTRCIPSRPPPCDGGQPDGPDASRLRPYHHHRRQSVATRRAKDADRAHIPRPEIHPLDAELRAPADLREGGGVSGPDRPLPALRVHRTRFDPARTGRPRRAPTAKATPVAARWGSGCFIG